MDNIINYINTVDFKGLQVDKILDIAAKEILSINLEKDSIFPKHISPTDANLIMLEGSLLFHMNDKAYALVPHQIFSFPKDVEHWVEAHKNSKFLIIR